MVPRKAQKAEPTMVAQIETGQLRIQPIVTPVMIRMPR